MQKKVLKNNPCPPPCCFTIKGGLKPFTPFIGKSQASFVGLQYQAGVLVTRAAFLAGLVLGWPLPPNRAFTVALTKLTGIA